MRKVLVLILGAGASGKSTLTRNICGDDGEELVTFISCYDKKEEAVVEEKVKYALFPNGVAIAGNVKNGSDSISRMEALSQVVNLLFTQRSIVIVDGVRSSQKFVDWLQEHPMPGLGLVFVYFDISLEVNLARLRKRRAENGKEEELPEKTYNNVLSFRSRAERVWKHARSIYARRPNAFVRIKDSTKPEQAAKAVWRAIHGVQQGIA